MNFRATGMGVAGIRTFLSLLGLCGGLAAVPAFGPSEADAVIFRPGLANQQDTFKRKAGVFKVSVKGVQVNRWSIDRQPQWECDVSAKGSGRERISFYTPARRMRIFAFGEGKADSAVFKPIPVRGKVTRKGKIINGSGEELPDHCFADGGGDPVEPPVPDCGTKAIRGAKLSPFAMDGKLTLDLAVGQKPVPKLFNYCDWAGRVWPGLLTTRGNGSKISTPFSPRWVFNPKFNPRTGAWSKVIMLARGSRVNRSFGTWYKTSINWSVTMKRLR